MVNLAKDPGRHAPLVLHDRRLDRVEQNPADAAGLLDEEGFVNQVPLGTIRKEAPPAVEALYSVFHTDGGRQPGKEYAPGAEHAPRPVEHGFEVGVIPGKVEHRAADDRVGERVRERHGFDRFNPKIPGVERWGEPPGEATDRIDGPGIDIGAEYFESGAEEVHEVSALPTPRIEDPGAGRETASKELIEEIDVNLTKLLFKF